LPRSGSLRLKLHLKVWTKVIDVVTGLLVLPQIVLAGVDSGVELLALPLDVFNLRFETISRDRVLFGTFMWSYHSFQV
jgi:hypothetical protein